MIQEALNALCQPTSLPPPQAKPIIDHVGTLLQLANDRFCKYSHRGGVVMAWKHSDEQVKTHLITTKQTNNRSQRTLSPNTETASHLLWFGSNADWIWQHEVHKPRNMTVLRFEA